MIRRVHAFFTGGSCRMTRNRLALRATPLRASLAFGSPAAGSNLRATADSKKAPLGRLFTLVGRAGFEPATN